MKWRAYPKYRDSGVEWLGEIPIDWNVMPLKYVCRESALYGANVPASEYVDEGVRFIRTTDIDDFGQLGTNDAVYLAPSLVAEYMLEDGELLLSRSGTIGRSFVYDEEKHGDCAYAGYLVGFKPKSMLSPRFAFYFTKAKQFEEWLSLSVISSTIGNVNAQKYANMPLPIPPPPEQRAIAAFLDRETAKLDALVAKQERLIELLQEKRAALISHAVTRGLDPTVPMKDSGTSWLGEIPAHWEVKRLKHISPSQSVGVVVNPSRYVVDEGVPFLFGADISEGHISIDRARRITEESNRLLNKSMLRAGDLVTVRVGYPGVTAVVPPELDGCNCASMMIVRQSPNFISQWLCYAMNSRVGSAQIEIVQYGAAQKQFNISHAVEFVFPVPPQDEQSAIAANLDHETAKLDALITKVREAIERLQEYRTALISAAVTGRIDVRQAAQP